MTVSINDFIKSHYEVVTSGAPLEECSVYCLTEIHDREDIERINGAFISTFASPGSVLLVESHESGASIGSSSYKARVSTGFKIDTPNITNILGWDKKKFLELEVMIKATDSALIIDRKSMPDSMFIPIDWKVQMEMASDNYIRDIDPVDREILDEEYCALLKRTFLALGEDLMESDRKEFSKLPSFEEFAINTAALSTEEEISLMYPGYLEELKRISLDRTRFIADYAQKALYNSWEERTTAMIQTLEKVRMLAFPGKTFLIAGKKHLIQDQKKLREFPIKSFEEYVASRADIAILTPKV